ncbi:MAG: RNA pseudouridine synthase [Rhodothermales bacterium]|nr:RNA pseudouridine synthase [Rhodothermales bacterium]MBO6780929.1 RNA pseudouridine synthase [Rhodothermales bacterium]
MTPEVVHLDNHLLVVVKPAGMLSQEDSTGDVDVVSWAKGYLKERFNKPGNVFVGLVHRLDRPASGLMVLARTSKAAGRLAEAFKARRVEKRYLALVEGFPSDSGRAEDHLLKEKRGVKVVKPGRTGAKRAVLTWRLLGAMRGQALVEVELETGRAHQIRAQLAHRGFPLVGDLRYGAKQEFDGRNLALHAYQLGLEHPVRREPVAWTSPPDRRWPDWARGLVS